MLKIILTIFAIYSIYELAMVINSRRDITSTYLDEMPHWVNLSYALLFSAILIVIMMFGGVNG